MKIALFLPQLTGGGAERVMLDLAKGLIHHGHIVELILLKAEGDWLDHIPDGCAVSDLNARRVRFAIWPLVVRMLRTRPDVLLAALPRSVSAALATKVLLGGRLKVVIQIVNTLSEELAYYRNVRNYGLKLTRAMMPLADRIVTVSDGVTDDMKQYHLPRWVHHRVKRIYNPVVWPEHESMKTEELPARWSHLFCDDVPVALAVGRLTDIKDHATLLRAFAEVVKYRRCRLVILGEGPERQNLLSLADSLGIGSLVSLPGFVPNPFAWMNRASIFVLSSRREGFGNVLVEAMSCGTPVVSTDCPHGPREILADGVFGHLVPVTDASEMAVAISSTLDAPLPASTLRERASIYSADTSIKQYMDMFWSLTTKTSRRERRRN